MPDRPIPCFREKDILKETLQQRINIFQESNKNNHLHKNACLKIKHQNFLYTLFYTLFSVLVGYLLILFDSLR